MLKCTAVIHTHRGVEKKFMVVPVLPNLGNLVTVGGGYSSSTYVVRDIEYVISETSGDTQAIHIHMEEKDA